MIEYSDSIAPRARSSGLVVRELEDEVLIFDVEREKAFCLNGTAGSVWKRCDGKTSIEVIRLHLEQELGTPVSMETVWTALAGLDEDQLLDEAVSLPETASTISRRDLMKRAGVTIAVPVIASLAVPAVALATGSCIGHCGPTGTPCTTASQCSGCVSTQSGSGNATAATCGGSAVTGHCCLPTNACTACASNCCSGTLNNGQACTPAFKCA